jgi:tetrahydromethanopterin S-methyltransferase subunit B
MKKKKKTTEEKIDEMYTVYKGYKIGIIIGLSIGALMIGIQFIQYIITLFR